MGSRDGFVHLHVHSEYSILDGKSSVASIVDKVSQDRAQAVGLTDHGSMGGMVKLIKECSSRGIKPIPGFEAYVAEDRKQRSPTRYGKQNAHMLLLAVTNTGYQNLMKLSSLATEPENFFYNPRVDNDLISQYSDGVIATTGCMSSLMNQALIHEDFDGAMKEASDLLDIFGRDKLFMEIQDHGIPEQRALIPDQLKIAKNLGIRLLATNDSHYTDRHDHEAHDALLCIGSKGILSDPDRWKFHGDQHYVKSAQEMRTLFPEEDFPGACDNTLLVGEMASVNVPLGETHLLPRFPIPDKSKSADQTLSEWVDEGAKDLYGNDDGVIPSSVQDRIDYEMSVIKDMGFVDYFLILGDAIKWARSRGIAIGPGRGSAAGSIVSYCVGITTVDPIHYGLYFERFLNPGRKSMPDIDIDFEPDRRDDVRQYMVDKYGRERFAQICTLGPLKAKSAIKDSARILELSHLGQKLADSCSSNISLSETLGPKSDLSGDNVRWWKLGEDLRQLRSSGSSDHQKIIDLALSIEGNIRQEGIHACAVLVTPDEMTNYVPVSYNTSSEFPVTRYEGPDVEAIGGLKLDFLSIINLTTSRIAVQRIKSDLGRTVDLDRIPLDDPAVFKLVQRGDVDGVFQLGESPGIRELMMRMKPTSFEDISALIALYRPGPMATGMHTDYADRKNGLQKVSYIHPLMKQVLGNTYGVVVYQEQVMQIAQLFAGYSAIDADNLRKAMGKKKAEVMEQEKAHFIDGVEGNSQKLKLSSEKARDLGETLWNTVEPFAGYAFNKSHSVAYGMISYQNAWLKAHFPAQYGAACIDSVSDSKVSVQVSTCRDQGISIYSPDINKSGRGATTSENAIWLGLSRIARCGNIANTLVREREMNGSFKSLSDFLVRTRDLDRTVNKDAVIALVQAGAFDSLHNSRKLMEEQVPDMIVDAKSEASISDDDFGGGIFDLDDDIESDLDMYTLDGDDHPNRIRMSNEVAVMGFFVGSHPFAEHQERVKQAQISGEMDQEAVDPNDDSIQSGVSAKIYGVVTDYTNKKSKKGNQRVEFTVGTGHGSYIKAIMFGRTFSDSDMLNLIIVSGSIKDESVEDESTELVITVSDLERIRLDNRRIRMVKGGSRRSRTSPSDPDPVEKESSGSPAVEDRLELARKSRMERAQRAGAPSPVEDKPIITEVERVINSVRFIVKSYDELIGLKGKLAEVGAGRVPVVITYQGDDVSHENLCFNITDDTLEEIEMGLGIDCQTAIA